MADGAAQVVHSTHPALPPFSPAAPFTQLKTATNSVGSNGGVNRWLCRCRRAGKEQAHTPDPSVACQYSPALRSFAYCMLQ